MTCGGSKISIFCLPSLRLRCEIVIKNCECLTARITSDGGFILSGWSDGSIRAFTPESGTLWFELPNAHRRHVTCLALSADLTMMVSGGSEGQIRLWNMDLAGDKPVVPRLMHTFHSHRASISSLQLMTQSRQCLSSSEDGTVIVWDLK